ncbi:hypothetical protein IFR05_009365 [Cadophora sp. M221]|nr:hypothetical protein IFR05_009365 [Cadophora sp. M221]
MSSTSLETFHNFNNLPTDLRVMIWELTFPHRTLSFTLAKHNDRAEDTPARQVSPMYAVENSDPQGIFAVPSHRVGPGGKLINNGLPLPSLVCPQKPARILALSVCKESRYFALRNGYQPWDVRDGRCWGLWYRRMIWNPKYDTVFLDEKHPAIRGQPLFVLVEKFKNSFPKQARELRSIALYTSHWNQKKPDEAAMVEKLVGFKSLTNIIVVMDRAYEKTRARNVIEDDDPLLSWLTHSVPAGSLGGGESILKKAKGVLFPKDLENDLRIGKKAREEFSNWVVPTVTFTDNSRFAQGITNGLELRLRSSPCPDLDAYCM